VASALRRNGDRRRETWKLGDIKGLAYATQGQASRPVCAPRMAGRSRPYVPISERQFGDRSSKIRHGDSVLLVRWIIHRLTFFQCPRTVFH